MLNAKKSFRKNFILFFIVILLFVGLIGLIFALPIKENLKISFAMLVLLIMIVVLILFKPRLTFSLERIMYFRLIENQGEPLKNAQRLGSTVFLRRIKDFGFESHLKTNDFTIYSYYAKDRKQAHLKRTMLLIYVLIHQQNISYQSKEIVKEINALEDNLYKNKKRIFNYTVFIAKEGQTLTPQIKSSCDFVSFSRAGKRYITNINIFHDLEKNSAYFLYNNNYAPNSYYRYAVDILKNFLA